MKPTSAFAVLLFSLFTVQSASAAVIGVRGGDSGSPPATNPSFFPLLRDDCTSSETPMEDPLYAGGYFCVTYSNPFVGEDGSIYAVDLQLKDPNGSLVPVGELAIAELSDFQMSRIMDLYTIRLCAGDSTAGFAACGGVAISLADFQIANISQDHFRVFTDLGPGYFTSIQALNTVPNVPEPATLLLLSVGLGAAATGRLRNRRK